MHESLINDLIDSISAGGKFVQNEDILYILWYENLVFVWIYEHFLQFEVIFYTNIVFLRPFSTFIAPPMVQSPWNLFSWLLRVIFHMFSPSL